MTCTDKIMRKRLEESEFWRAFWSSAAFLSWICVAVLALALWGD